MIGAPGSAECSHNAAIVQAVCEQVGLPIKLSKSVSPASTIVFLGTEIDSIQGVLRLPAFLVWYNLI